MRRPATLRISAIEFGLLLLLAAEWQQVALASGGGKADDSTANEYGAWGPWSPCSAARCAAQRRTQLCVSLCPSAYREEVRPCSRRPCGGGRSRADGGAPRSSHESVVVVALSGFAAWDDELTLWSSWSECRSGCKWERWRSCRDGRQCSKLLRTADGGSIEVQPLLKQQLSCAAPEADCIVAEAAAASGSHPDGREPARDDRDAVSTLSPGFPTEAVVDLGVTCGQRKSLPSQRVIGGKPARRGEWPWQVAIVYKRSRSPERENYSDFPYYGKGADALFTPLGDDDGSERQSQQGGGGGEDMVQHCGGALIAPQWVLTAAHCVLENGTSKLKRRLAVVAGEPDLKVLSRDSRAAARRRHEITRIYWHRDFEWDRVDSDLALIKLAEPVRLDGVSTAAGCLPSRHLQLRVPLVEHERPRCHVLGWGNTRSSVRGSSSARLQQAEVPLVPQRTCRKAFAKGVTRNQFCAGWADGRSDACDGDSGGPLMCQVQAGADDYRWVVYGVTSFGPDDGCGVAGKYGVYVKVSNFVDWISNIMLNGGGKAASKRTGDGQPPPQEPLGDDPFANDDLSATAAAIFDD